MFGRASGKLGAKMTGRKFLWLLVLLTWGISLDPRSARAESSATEIIAVYDKGSPAVRSKVETAFEQFEAGMGWSNTYLQRVRKTVAIYCSPGKLAFTGSQLIDILRRRAKEDAHIAEAPWGMGMLFALQYTFPCTP